jgi:hypothetical protein
MDVISYRVSALSDSHKYSMLSNDNWIYNTLLIYPDKNIENILEKSTKEKYLCQFIAINTAGKDYQNSAEKEAIKFKKRDQIVKAYLHPYNIY